jgi:O-acetyl-ADP-ribose deacetylase (regulator of RNase III)
MLVSRPLSHALHQGKEPPLPIAQEAGWGPEPSRTRWRRKKSLALPGIKARFLGPQPSHLADYAVLAATGFVRRDAVFYICDWCNVIHTTLLVLVLIVYFTTHRLYCKYISVITVLC